MTYKYSLKPAFTLGYIILNCIGILLIIGRWLSIFNNNFIIINTEINSHISNLSLSMIFYLLVGNIWLQFGIRFRFIIFLAIFLIAGNFLYETLIGFMNVIDIIDAIYGVIGIAISFVYLFITNKYGLIPTNSEKL